MLRKILMSTITAAAAAFVIFSFSACDIYFEEDFYTYCDRDGCYACDGYGCDPIRFGEGQDGWACQFNSNCEDGCFCNDQGYCEEAGFCEYDGTCDREGFECDERDTCVPDASCKKNERKPGFICNDDTGIFEPGCDVENPCPSNTEEECIANQCIVPECNANDKKPGFICDDSTGEWVAGCDQQNPCDTDAGDMCLSGQCSVPTCEQITTEEMCKARQDDCLREFGAICRDIGKEDCTSVNDCNCRNEDFGFLRCKTR